MSNDLIVAYKFGSQFDGQLSAREGINLYKLHAQEHEGKVLFTINKAPRPEFRDRIKKIILMTRNGKFAIIGKVNDLGKGSIIKPSNEYTAPSIWDNEDRSSMGWFAIEDLEQIQINPGDFTSINGKDLLDSMSANAYMTYIEI